jgi:tRNA A-37 threonylcarbamoyl transferase component Bud32
MSGPESNETSAGLPSPGPDETDALVGRVIADRYRIDALLGVGGMGAVYRAEHILMKKAVAVKVLHREMTAMDEVVKRFEREAIAAGRIDHPNVTVATDFGKLEDGAFYLVLEYVPGRSLTDVLKEDGALSEERALFIARQIAAGLGAAHRAGIVHRDLKPDNVMLIERGGTKDFVKVLDFGIAKVSAESNPGTQLTRIGAVFGTPAYMAPEQAAGQSVDQRADLYSLGHVLFEMLAGHAAFESDEVVALLAKQLTESPPPLPASVSPEVAALVVKLLEKDPRARVQTAEELVLAIDAWLGPASPNEGSGLGVPSARSSSVLGQPVSVAAATIRVATSPGILERFRAGVAVVRSGRTLPVLGNDVPVPFLAAGAVALVLAVVLVTTMFRAPKSTSPAHAEPEPAQPDLSEVMRRAEEGEGAAVRELEARSEASRSGREWMAIGKGHSRLGAHRAAVDAFQHSITRDPTLSQDAVMLRDVRRAADDEAAQSRAFELATGPLGEGGADVLFDVWASTTEKTETTALAKSLLDREEIRKKASRPLRVALELRRTTRCEDVKRLVIEATEIGDERAFRPLNQLNPRRGCGFLGLSDCYPCLRKDGLLPDALKAVQQKKGPRF